MRNPTNFPVDVIYHRDLCLEVVFRRTVYFNGTSCISFKSICNTSQFPIWFLFYCTKIHDEKDVLNHKRRERRKSPSERVAFRPSCSLE